MEDIKVYQAKVVELEQRNSRDIDKILSRANFSEELKNGADFEELKKIHEQVILGRKKSVNMVLAKSADKMEETTYIIENAENLLNQRAKEIT